MKKSMLGIALGLVTLALVAEAGVPKRTVKRYDAPDKSLYAVILTVHEDSIGSESSVEMRSANGKFIGRRNFFRKSKAEGLGVVRAQWSYDSRFFVFSTMASGGRFGGRFPTYFYSVIDNKVRALDPVVGRWITDPEFHLEPEDLITVTVHDTLRDGTASDALVRSIRLSEIGK